MDPSGWKAVAEVQIVESVPGEEGSSRRCIYPDNLVAVAVRALTSGLDPARRPPLAWRSVRW